MSIQKITDGIPLIADSNFPRVELGKNFEVGNGIIAEGTILGIVTTSQEVKPYAAENTDGSQSPKYINPREVDTTTAMKSVVWATGVINKAKVTNVTDAAIETLENRSIFIKEI